MQTEVPLSGMLQAMKFLNEQGFFASKQRFDMKYRAFGLCLLGAVAFLTGCETPYGTPDRTGTGALAGGAIGAFSGAVIGGRHAGEGALIGAAVGAITGGLIGHSMDMDAAERERLQAEAPATYARVEQGQPLAVADVKALTASKVGDDVIISQIQNTHSVYHLSAADIIDLHNADVSEKVIQYMINTPGTATAAPVTTDVSDGPPAPPSEVVTVAPGPGYVWVPGSWQWQGRWVWMGGYWAATPYPTAVWVDGYWRRGPYGWHWVPGHWR
jgi:outer membrane lipoprotein SlyB